MAKVTTSEIPNLSVYGVPQVQYQVDGQTVGGFVEAAIGSALLVTTASEKSTAALASLLRARQKKLEVINYALVDIAIAISRITTDERSSSSETPKEGDISNRLATLPDRLRQYGLDLHVWQSSGYNVTNYGRLSKCQADTEFATQKEDNELQQDMISIRNFVSKRDSAFSTASTIMRKVVATGASIVNNLRR